MVRINLETAINVPLERVFDLSRSIELHMASTNFTGEEAIAGVTSGCIGPSEKVTWKARHFGVKVKHTSLITAYQFPTHFQDSMVQGLFRRFIHDHFFQKTAAGTLMKDVMEFEVPWGLLGRIAERIVLEKHLRQLLLRRNQCIKRVAESDDWRRYVHPKDMVELFAPLRGLNLDFERDQDASRDKPKID
jgi:ligand-binding SRPBCC domain-containing protein